MNNLPRLLFSLLVTFTFSIYTYANCGDTWNGSSETSTTNSCSFSGQPENSAFTKTVTWAHIFWVDGHERTNIAVSDTGEYSIIS